MGAPLILSIAFVPLLLNGYGSERFGVITILWLVVGYMGIFDFGMGRALTKYVSENRCKDAFLVSSVVWKISLILLAFGCVLGVGVFGYSEELSMTLVKVEGSVRNEVDLSLKILSIVIPVAIFSSGVVGVLEGVGDFKLINILRLISGTLNFVGPYLTLGYGIEVYWAMITMAVVRVATTLILTVRMGSYYRFNCGVLLRDLDNIKLIFNLGAWITISNILAPVLGQLDKFFLAGALSISLLAYYSIPSDVVNKLFFLPSAVMSVFFPMYAKSIGNYARSKFILKKSADVIFFGCAPCFFILMMFGGDILSLWLGDGFRVGSEGVIQILSWGFLFNCMARVPHAFLQAVGKAKYAALINVAELPIFVFLLIFLVDRFSVIGAAFAWSARMLVDFIVLGVVLNKTMIGVYRPIGGLGLIMASAITIASLANFGLYWKVSIISIFSIVSIFLFFKNLREVE